MIMNLGITYSRITKTAIKKFSLQFSATNNLFDSPLPSPLTVVSLSRLIGETHTSSVYSLNPLKP